MGAKGSRLGFLKGRLKMKVKFEELKPSQLKAVQGGALGTVMQSAAALNRAESEYNLLKNENQRNS
jgi:hypothetical protein